jgi:hypothetical protein
VTTQDVVELEIVDDVICARDLVKRGKVDASERIVEQPNGTIDIARIQLHEEFLDPHDRIDRNSSLRAHSWLRRGDITYQERSKTDYGKKHRGNRQISPSHLRQRGTDVQDTDGFAHDPQVGRLWNRSVLWREKQRIDVSDWVGRNK